MESEQLRSSPDEFEDLEPGSPGSDTGAHDRTKDAIITGLDLEMSEDDMSTIKVPLTGEMRQELEGVIRRRGWDPEEGLVTVLATGISQLSAQDRQNAPASAAAAAPTREGGQAWLDPVTQELAYYHAMYSAMKFRASSLLDKLKVVELRERGLRGMVALNKKWAAKARADIETLKAENAELQQRVRELSQESLTGSPTDAHGRQATASGRGKQDLLGRLRAFLSIQGTHEA